MDSPHDELTPKLASDVEATVAESESTSVAGPVLLPKGSSDDTVIELNACHETEPPRLTLILPEEPGTVGMAERLALVPDDEEPALDAADSSAFTSFNEWAEQVSSYFSSPADEKTDIAAEEDTPMKKIIARVGNVPGLEESLWSNIEPVIRVAAVEHADMEPELVTSTAEADVPVRSFAATEVLPATGGPMLPPPPAPERIGAGKRVEKHRGWRPSNPFAGLAIGPLGDFRWRQMWRAAAVVGVPGAFAVLLRRILA